MTWCRSRITGLRIMLPALDPMLRSLIRAMAVELRPGEPYPDRLELPLEQASLAELELAADLLSRLAGSAREEAQRGPARLLDSLVSAVRAAEHEARGHPSGDN
ncbi:MAG: hypothetical protein HKP27_00650 [Myxococcales bacterium]|nr:hypothetical protein [Myxococcales bacterium]